ncbi:MAG: hypothetical protein ACLUTO_14310 [Anaerostipes sp.]
MLAEQYFKKERTNKKRTEAYLLLISLLNDPEKEVEQKDLVSALKICQQDVCDFWSAYFFIDHYILWQEKLPEGFLNTSRELIYKMQKLKLSKDQKKMLEEQRINLYEIMAQKGDTKLFFKRQTVCFMRS